MQELKEAPVFTRYNIEDTLGSGGMGTVYLAHHNILNRSVALKVPKQELIQNEFFVERFLREARALGTLNHPHIVSVYDAGIEQGIPYIAMEYVAGDTLAQSIFNHGQIDFLLAASWGLQMAKALAYLHDRQILHRDLKSSNVIIDCAGNAVIADFGIAQIKEDSNLTRGLLGTPSYISPEQAKGETLDARSDLYSLGVILYECLTGRLPFRDENSFALIQKVIHEAPADIWNHRPDAPVWLCDLVAKCLEKNPDRRFQDGTALAAALQMGLPEQTSLMRAEPADTIVSRKPEEEETIADHKRSYALAYLAKSLHRPEGTPRMLPHRDPSPTLTMFSPSQIIRPVKRERSVKAVMNPITITMAIVVLGALILVPINKLPSKTANGQQNKTELTLSVENPEKSTEARRSPATQKPVAPPAPETNSRSSETSTLPTEPQEEDPSARSTDRADVAEPLPTSEPPASSWLDEAGDMLNFFADAANDLAEDSVEYEMGFELKRTSVDSGSTDPYGGTEEAPALQDPGRAQAETNEPTHSSIEIPSLEKLASSKPVTSESLEVDVNLLEDQLDVQSQITRTVDYSNQLPQSIATLSTLKNRTQLVRALAVYQSQKVLLFGTRSNVKEPEHAFIFLINKDNNKVRGLLAPGREGWIDAFSGKIVTEENGRFYESEPDSEVSLKWWLHDVTPIWVEMKQHQKLVPGPRSAAGSGKRMGW